MKRDMDLVRKIVFALEGHEHGHAPDELAIDGYTEEQIGYHVYIMTQAGLILGADATTRGNDSPNWIPISLTWDGHEFADDARSDTIWNRAKAQVRESVTTVGFGLLVEVLKHQAKQALGIS